jgi:glucose/arabinose dehydrogenase
MKKLLLIMFILLGTSSATFAANAPELLHDGLKLPESVCVGNQGVLYLTEIGERNQNGDGQVIQWVEGKKSVVATGLDDPKGIVFYRDALYLTDKTKLVKIDLKNENQKLDYLTADKFPSPPLSLNDIAVEGGSGMLLVSDSGLDGKGGAVYRIDMRLSKIETVADGKTIPGLAKPNGVIWDGASHFIMADMTPGDLYRVRVADRHAVKIATDMPGADGLVWDQFGRFFISCWTTGKVFAIPRPGEKPILIGEGFQSAADGCLSDDGQSLLIPDMKGGSLHRLATRIPGWEVDTSPAPVALQLAFPKLRWTGWDDGSESGTEASFRPILLTHAGDGSNRVFVPQQQGIVHVFPNDDQATDTKIFIDISSRVRYHDKQNEEGLLGLAFHPQFRINGEFFVFYTEKNDKFTNVVSRFRVKKEDPTTADPTSEEVLIRFERPFWNHDGGTILFGPDGYLYITHGDGGSRGDPLGNGQNISSLLGKVLRIDVNTRSNNKPYGIPTDNPFMKGAAPEIWCYGLRNVWRMAVDRQTGDLWGADVGQGLYEEINILRAGGNYGWKQREGLHPFDEKNGDLQPGMVEPIWEYHHSLGVSITGGTVYRGRAVPELAGAYVYGDYVSNRMWALRYDPKLGRVVENRPFPGNGVAIMSFGEDEQGEVYVMGNTRDGRSIYRIVRADKK